MIPPGLTRWLLHSTGLAHIHGGGWSNRGHCITCLQHVAGWPRHLTAEFQNQQEKVSMCNRFSSPCVTLAAFSLVKQNVIVGGDSP